MYIDFGENIDNSANRGHGHLTEGADQFGHYWNNICSTTGDKIPANSSYTLINSANQATKIIATVNAEVATNGLAVAGGLENPSEENLRDLAVPTATEDYFYVTQGKELSIVFAGVDPNKVYRVHSFGSRATNDGDQRWGYVRLEGSNDWKTRQDYSGRTIGGRDASGKDIHGNIRNIAVSDYITPTPDGKLTFTVEQVNGFSHLNALKLEEFSSKSTPKQVYNMVELAISGTAIDEEGTDPVELHLKLSKNGNSRAREIYLADPTIYAENGKFYMAGTRSYGPQGFTLLESSDLKHWAYAKKDSMILIKDQQTYGSTGFWAPQIFKDGNKYLFAYTANEQTAVAKADNLTDLYTQATIQPVDGSAKNIDPFIFRDDDGKYYFYHVRFNGGNILHVAEFDPETCKFIGNAKECFRNTEAWENTNAYPSAPIMEGPTVMKIDGLYYMFYSANHYLSTDYAVGYATATSPMGPWTKNPASPIIHRNIVGEMGSGHGDIFFDNDGNMRYVYHVHHDETKANPRRTRIITLNVDKSKGQPYTITADPSSIIVPTMHPIDGKFSGYVRLKPGTYSFSGVTEKGEPVSYGETNGALAVDGAPFTENENRLVRIEADTRKGTLALTPVTSMSVKGSIVDKPTEIEYAGRGIWSSEVTIDGKVGGEYINRNIYFAVDGNDALALKRIAGTNRLAYLPDGVNGENIRLNQGTYTMTVDMNNRVFDINADIDQNRISVFGSSVANGQGAENFKGYAYKYGELLKKRHENGSSPNPFYTSGVSIGGNTTTALMNRYDDLTRDFGKFVIIGLSLGNEGIHGATNPRDIMTQFRQNMQKLIAQARADGKIPVVMNNYTRDDFTKTDYANIKQTNLYIHEWDVPSFNTLGAIDDGTGRWAAGYMADGAHPNTSGHAEFMYSMVPSLFDALIEGKPLPVRDITHELTLEDKATLEFTPEETTHSFTISLRVKGATPGKLLSFVNGIRKNTTGSLVLNADGTITYDSPQRTDFTTETAPITDDGYHYVTLTHYYAWGRTMLYVDKKLYGTTEESLVPGTFTIGDSQTDCTQTLSELYFWRAGMNDKEIISLTAGKMLKSSLELYTPMNIEEATEEAGATEGEARSFTMPNNAQSLNTVTYRIPESGGINETDANAVNATPVAYYAPDGREIAPAEATDGIYIVRYSDGSVRKLKL